MALLSEYECGKKLLAVFPLDGNIRDIQSNQFEFVDDSKAILRWSKVPRERLDPMELIGMGNEETTRLGYLDADLMVLDVAIKKRIEANQCKKDENGDFWEVQEKLLLPFKCCEKLFDKKGNELVNFCMHSNRKGFLWAFFWLLAWTPPKPKRSKRIGAKTVTVVSNEESSLYLEETVSTRRSRRALK